ncbi:hypothetical protein [Nonomuraea aurantiaca]|uniref:hypothetical protein n=1 Tax=Nonomuraea aurantiaca TaxID=2878562 RepID=UPI001CD96318|nr:hypothetical protein [Nonomuraea aurantiaca]MCA2220146.1 hypothetical protein [Nonomuraea aurantiaca]
MTLLVRSAVSGEALSDERAYLVLKNALAVANPDYEVAFDFADSSFRDAGDGRELPVTFEGQGDGMDAAEMSWQDKLVLSYSGDVRVPAMPRTQLTAALEAFGAPARSADAKRTIVLLKESPADVYVKAVDELRSPPGTAAMAGIWSSNFDVFLLFESRGFKICASGKRIGIQRRLSSGAGLRYCACRTGNNWDNLGLKLSDLRD